MTSNQIIVPILQMAGNPPEKQFYDPTHNQGQPLRLHYFRFRGACQPIIHLLYYLDIDFEMAYQDKTAENVSDVGFNLGIPYIQDGEIRVHQTLAIMQYLCRKCDIQTMIGLTPQAIARNQQLLMKYFAQRKKINILLLETICQLPTKPDKRAFVQNFLKRLCGQCKYVECCLKRVSKGSKFVSGDISIVDFLFYQTCFYVAGFFGKYISNGTIYRFFRDFKNHFETLPFLLRNKKQIEQTALFMAFGDEAVNTAIEEMWEGGPYKLIYRA